MVKPAKGSRTTKRGTIAIVDDNAPLLMLLRYNLEASYSLRLYDNTHVALELIDTPVDLIFLDGSNHPFSGIELYRRLRPATKAPIIFLSAWASSIPDELRQRGLPPADGYIDKPFSIPGLKDEIERRLRRR